MEQSLVLLEKLDAKNLPELKGIEESQLKLVEENPYIEIVDNKTYEEAKKRRTALLKGRTSLESQEKTIASKLSNFRKQVGTVTKELIDITLPHEEKQQEEVKRYEQIKENERLEKERLENERIDGIKKSISDFESKCHELINSMTFENGLETKSKLDLLFNSDLDVQEFDILLQQAKMRVQSQFDVKASDLQEKENQRIENERLRKEKEEADAKLKAIQDQQEKERAEREAKEREEKEKDFIIRVKRLNEIGIILNGLNYFVYPLGIRGLKEFSKSQVLNFDAIEFEEYFESLKNSIQEAKENHEKEQAEKEAREKAEIEAKKKADKENKERTKRLAKDKAVYKQVLTDQLGRFPIVFDSDQQEVKNFSIEASNRVTDLLNQLLTELENL